MTTIISSIIECLVILWFLSIIIVLFFVAKAKEKKETEYHITGWICRIEYYNSKNPTVLQKGHFHINLNRDLFEFINYSETELKWIFKSIKFIPVITEINNSKILSSS